MNQANEITFTRIQAVRRLHSNRSLREIHDRAVDAAEAVKSKEVTLIKALQDVERFLVHRHIGYNSPFRYGVEALRLSEAQAYMYISVARTCEKHPALLTAIEKGEIAVSKAQRLASVINEKNQEHWLALAKTLDKKRLEREIAKVNPAQDPALRESVRFVNDSRLLLRMGISENTHKDLMRAQHLISQSEGCAASLELTLEKLLEFYLQRKDPVQKADRAAKLDEQRRQAEQSSESTLPRAELPTERSESTLPQAKLPKERSALSIALRHAVSHRDRGFCQCLMPNGAICGEERFVEIHHLWPVANGGRDELENLITLCSAHHQDRHAEV